MSDSTAVLEPLLAVLAVAGIFAHSVWKLNRRPGVPLEIGTVYAAIVSLYVVVPLVSYLLGGMSFSVFHDFRLFAANPFPQEIGSIGWYHVIHLTAFCAAYRLLRGRDPAARRAAFAPERLRLGITLVLFLAVAGYFAVLGQMYDLSASDYQESYIVVRRLPLLLAQITVHCDGLRLTLELVLLTLLFADYRRYRTILIAALALVAVETFLKLGSRAEFVVLSVAAVLLYHQRVRPISAVRLGLAGVAGMVIFLAAGALRGRVLELEPGLWRHPFAYTNEFESIFANAFDVQRLRERGSIERLPISFHLVDLLAFVPQQLSPLPKVSPSDWYIETFYPQEASTGAGFAFGTISESILGGGWPDLILRGALLGALTARLHNWRARRATFWADLVYVWTTAQIYYVYRNTTFCLLGLFVYRVIPVIVAVEIGMSVFSEVPKRPRREPAHA